MRRARRQQRETMDFDSDASSSCTDSCTSGSGKSTSSSSSNSSVSSDSDSEGSTDPACEAQEHATSVATSLAQAKQQPVSQPPLDTGEGPEGPAVATSAPGDHLWDWFWASAPNSVKKNCDRLKLDGFDGVRVITLLRRDNF